MSISGNIVLLGSRFSSDLLAPLLRELLNPERLLLNVEDGGVCGAGGGNAENGGKFDEIV